MSNAAANAQREWRPETIRDLLTADRLTSYLDSCGDDLYRALELYEWNLAASAAARHHYAWAHDPKVALVLPWGRVDSGSARTAPERK